MFQVSSVAPNTTTNTTSHSHTLSSVAGCHSCRGREHRRRHHSRTTRETPPGATAASARCQVRQVTIIARGTSCSYSCSISLARAHSMADISLCVNHTASRTSITATRGCDRAICTRTSYADLRQASAQRHTTTSLLPASTDRSPAGARRSTETKGTTRTLTRATNTNAVHHGPLVVLIVLLAPLRVRVRVCSPIARRSSTSSRESLLLRAPPLPPKLP